MVTAFGTGTWGRGRESHLNLKPLEGVAKAHGPASLAMPPPYLDQACRVLLLDFDAFGNRELELPLVMEQRAIRRAQPKQHTRYEARREEREAEAEREHPHEEVFPFGFRKEVGPLKAAIGAPFCGSPAADESPK
jgi:hypothetical protein